MESRTFTASFSELDKMMSFIRTSIETPSLSERNVKQFEVAVEEALVNVIKYAYKPPAGTIEIECGLDEGNRNIIVKIIDGGVPFNPLKVEGFVSPVSLETQSLGGLGIHFIRKMSDSLKYEWIDDNNVLTLTKKINAQGN